MLLEETNTVSKGNGRTECRYCNMPIGAQHEPDCVCRQKTVVLKLIVPVLVAVPQHWDREAIEFSANESSSCFDNLVGQFIRQTERLEEARTNGNIVSCYCMDSDSTFERDATEADHERFLYDDGLVSI